MIDIDKEIRVLHVFSKMKLGGMTAQFIKSLDFYADINVKKYVYTMQPSDSYKSILENKGVFMFRSNRTGSRFGDVLKIINIVKNEKIDIIHTHLIGAEIIGGLSGFMAGVPVVSTLHGSQLPKKISKDYIFRRYFSRYLINDYVCISEYSKQINLNHFKIDEKKLNLIYNGIDKYAKEPIVESGELAFDDEFFNILNVGRLSRVKGQDMLIDAMRDLLNIIPQARLYIAGEGAEREYLQSIIKKFSLENSVFLLGKRDDVNALLSACDLFVFPSRNESFGNAVLEAMLNGIPIVCSSAGALPELMGVENKEYVFDVNDKKDMIEKIEKAYHVISDKKSDVEFIGYDIDRFSMENTASSFGDLYRKHIN